MLYSVLGRRYVGHCNWTTAWSCCFFVLFFVGVPASWQAAAAYVAIAHIALLSVIEVASNVDFIKQL